MATHAYLVIDTNIFIHYKPIEQIPWPAIVGAEQVTILIAAIVARELDHKKNEDSNPTRRNRAARVVSFLFDRKDDGESEIREHTTLRFLPADPIIDFERHGLVRAVPDDVLIAATLQFRGENEGADVRIVTMDLGLNMKADGNGIQVARLDDEYRLPFPSDPRDKESRELRTKLARHEDHTPDLQLVFESGLKHTEFRATPFQVAEEAIVRKTAELKNAYPPIEQKIHSIMGPNPQEIARYNEESLPAYYREWEKFFRKLARYEAGQRLLLHIQLGLSNTGTCPATDIDVYVTLPSALLIIRDKSALPKPPVPPEPPPRPKSKFVAPLATNLFRGGLSLRDNIPAFNNIDVGYQNVSAWNFEERKDHPQARTNVGTAKHGHSVPLDPLYLAFPTWDHVQSFNIPYQLHAANLAQPARGECHVEIKRGE